VTYTEADARQQLLATLAEATEHLGVALAALGAAYEELDENTADRLEEELFRPVQVAYGRAKRAYDGFAQRSGFPTRAFAQPAAGHPTDQARAHIDRAVANVQAADGTLATLQDSMLPVEVGDPELRAALSDVREHVGATAQRARDLVRILGR
jgi:hypothetical protein